jgi:hypothetical protein
MKCQTIGARKRANKMAKTHDVGKFYWHLMTYPVKPPVVLERAETQEIDGQYRFGKGWCLRLPLTRKSSVMGKWIKTYSESEALTVAINGRRMDQEEVDWDVIRFGASYEDI